MRCGVCVDVGAPTSVRRLKTTQQLPAAGTGKRSLQRVAGWQWPSETTDWPRRAKTLARTKY